MKAHRVHIRIARLTIDGRLTTRGAVSADVLSDAIQSELASSMEAAPDTARPARAASPNESLARLIAEAVTQRVARIDGLRPLVQRKGLI